MSVAIIAVVFLAASEALIRTHVVPNQNLYRYVELFRNSPLRNAIFGDSHFAYGVTGLSNFVNVSYQGNNFTSIAEKVHLYFSERVPGQVILQAGVHHFSQDFLIWKQKKRDNFADLLVGRSTYFPLVFAPENRIEIFNYWKIFLSGRDFKPPEKFMADGSRLNSTDYSLVPQQVRSAAAQRTALIFQPMPDFRASETAKLYEETVDFVQKKGGTVCFVTLPVFSRLRDEIKDDSLYGQAIAFFDDLATRKGVRYVNILLEDLPDRDFTDPHHLNENGARSVSASLKQACFE